MHGLSRFSALSMMLCALACGGGGGEDAAAPDGGSGDPLVQADDVGGDLVVESALGRACGGASRAPCGAGEYCRRPVGACQGQGVCAPRPDACTMIVHPVCGCDGETYSNACQAAVAGVTVARDGTCMRVQ